MLDSYHRNINYLRISVTDRCNLRCIYCIPEEGVKLMSHKDILSFEEIVEVVKVGVKFGIDKVRITGGEPLIRKDIVSLVKMISNIHGITDLSMTTNGILLEKFALLLKDAGLQRVNISLDTMDSNKYKIITRGGDINEVFAGIKAAQEAGFSPIKINCVIKDNSAEKDALAVSHFCKLENLEIRYIREMDLHKGSFSIVEGGDGGHCYTCNRLRLTANGNLKPCLFNDLEFNVRQFGIKRAFQKAIVQKPKCGSKNSKNEFNNIGG
ncbi:MAG: radical SAM protein [Bacteroidota bacterium]